MDSCFINYNTVFINLESSVAVCKTYPLFSVQVVHGKFWTVEMSLDRPKTTGVRKRALEPDESGSDSDVTTTRQLYELA